MKISVLFKSVIWGAIATVLISGVAFPQSTILIVDQARVLRDSDVGQHVKRQVESIAKQMESEIQAQVSPLSSERDKLVAELKNIGVDALTRPDLQKRAQDLQVKGEKSQLEAAYKQRELAITEQKAISKINKKLETIVEVIVAERNADVILDRSLVIYGGKTADVTDTVISRLNSQMRTVTVVRERLPRKKATGT